MTRNDIKAIFPEATKEAIDQLLDINSSDIGKAMTKAQTTQDNLESRMAALTEQIKTLTTQKTELDNQVRVLTEEVAQKDGDIKRLTEEKDTAVNEAKAQHEVDVKTLTNKQEEALNELREQLKAAQDKALVADTLTNKVAQLTQDVADRDATIASNNKAYKIKDELRGLHARNVDVIWPLLDLNKITEKDGKLNGLTEQVEALQKSDAYLFDINTGASRGGVDASPEVGSGVNVNDAVNQAIRSLSGRG